jgi:hypothetical protein
MSYILSKFLLTNKFKTIFMGDIADYYANHGQDWLDGQEEITSIKPKLHKCKDGSILDIRGISKEYPKMTNEHLLNTIKYIETKALNGIKIVFGGSGNNAEDMWYDEEILTGKKALKHLKYKHYINEALKRNIAYKV